ncbi:4-phosphoerythronate dehydrogenase [Alteromonas sp. H39]|uniref:4-phosphoerythronate dehydrogenase n=1 Tax=Alteromonas sp. H39 TaxID=3389876 RepID=UPI0039E1BBF8
MKILVEDTIPFGREYMNTLGDTVLYSWQSLRPEMLGNTDYLVVRSTTQVDSTLLQHADTLRFVTTATAGTNHLDKASLEAAGIQWDSAGGCNAVAVAEYVISALLRAEEAGHVDLSSATVGIVGAGHVGSALASRLDCLKIAYQLCDPPLEDAGDARDFCTLDDILTCDIISLHVPLITNGDHPTLNLIDHAALSTLTDKQVLINACRGEVVDESALLTRLSQPAAPVYVTDVYWREPDINMAVIDAAWLATPHIAGHSVEGKTRGTQMVYEQLCGLMEKPVALALNDFLEPVAPLAVTLEHPQRDRLSRTDLRHLFFSIYDINEDDRYFRQAMAESNQFAALRKAYRVRRECSAYTLQLNAAVSDGIRAQLQCLGFTLQFP